MAKKKFEPNSEYRVDFNQYATDKILRVFESENLNPLAMEWLSIRPYNVNKGTDYNGVNRLIMSVESALIGDPRYCPKGQVRDIGANNKGLNYDMRIKSGKTSFCAYNVQNLNNFESEYFGIASSNKTYVENDNFVEAVHNLTETVENAVVVNFELLTSIILARFMAQDINYPLGKIATSNKQWIKFLESDNTAICKASAEAQKRYNKILADCGLEDCITKAPEKSIVSKFGDSYKDAIAKLKVESERIAELTPEPKAEPKPTPKPKAEPMSDFAKAVNMDAINKLSQKDLKRVLAILEKV